MRLEVVVGDARVGDERRRLVWRRRRTPWMTEAVAVQSWRRELAHARDAGDAGERAQALLELRVVADVRVVARRSWRARQLHVEGEQAVGIEAERRARHRPEAAREEPGAREQAHDRARSVRRRARRAAAATGGSRSSRASRRAACSADRRARRTAPAPTPNASPGEQREQQGDASAAVRRARGARTSAAR